MRDRIAAILAGFAEVKSAYLFGSQARGTATPTSDVDVAILVPRDLPRHLGDVRDQAARALEHEFGMDIDLVDLARAPVDLVHRVLRDGDLVLDRDPSARIAFIVRRRAEYFDLKPHLDRYRQAALS